MRSKKLVATVISAVAAALIFGTGTPAMAAGPNIAANIYDGGNVITATAYTNSWVRGTVRLRVRISRDGVYLSDKTWTCAAATSCSVNPSPIVLDCSCPGTYAIDADAYGPRTGGVTHVWDTDTVVASLVGGKLVLKEVSP
jgi:hypothetical protein